MNFSDKIFQFGKTEKDVFWKYYCAGSRRIRKPFDEFNAHELNALVLLSIEKPFQLCIFFKAPFFHLEKTINYPSYEQFVIKKKKGGVREIDAPSNQLKRIQKRLNYYLQAYYLCIKPIEVNGFVIHPHYLGTSCNIVENAKPHIKKKYLLNIDLKDFFPSITAKQVKELFTSETFGFSEQISTALTLLTTFQGKLPIGAPTSPAISNFICKQLDADLIQFSKVNLLTYTRYADDLTFSSNEPITNDIVLDIINVIQNNNFKINESKLRKRSSNRKQVVTGLTVNDKVNVDRKLLKKIRAMLHDFTTNGIESATRRHFNLKGDVAVKLRAKFIHRLEGYINFVGQVRGKDDSLFIKFKEEFDSIFKIHEPLN
jgi:RNA-directed DNA polymerase